MNTTTPELIGDTGLVAEYSFPYKSNQIRLEVRRGGEILGHDEFKLDLESRRSRYIKNLQTNHPTIITDNVAGQLRDYLLKLVTERNDVMKAFVSSAESSGPAEADVASRLAKLPKEAVEAAWTMLTSDDLFGQISKDIERLGIVGEVIESRTIYAVMTSRLLSKPISGCLMGASSGGKSYKIETIAQLMPPQGKVMAHDFSPKVMSHMPEGSLEHKVVISGERVHDKYGKEGQTEDHGKPFREMLGSGIYRVEFVDKDENGHFIVRHIEQKGPIAYIESTTATYLSDEDSTRMIKLDTDETEEQTGRIVDLQKRESDGRITDNGEREFLLDKHYAAQVFIDPFPKEPPQIIIPFIYCVTLPCSVVATRRTFPQVISMIEVVALLRRYHPSKTGGVKLDFGSIESFNSIKSGGERTVIVADKEDYRIAYDMLLPILESKYGTLPAASRELLNTINKQTGNEGKSITLSDGRKTEPSTPKTWNDFTVQECQEWAGISNSEVWRRLNTLSFKGILSCDKAKKPYKFKIVDPKLADTTDFLSDGFPHPDKMDELIEKDSLRRGGKEGIGGMSDE